MGELVRRWTLSIFAVVFIGGAAFMHVRQGYVEWRLLSAIAGGASLIFGIRAFVMLRRDARREAAERADRFEEVFEEACEDIVDAISRLSLADLSVFVTCDRMLAGGEQGYSFMTARGSPVHRILVALADIRCARPLDMQRISPQSDASLASYELTEPGRVMLPAFLAEVARRTALRCAASG